MSDGDLARSRAPFRDSEALKGRRPVVRISETAHTKPRVCTKRKGVEIEERAESYTVTQQHTALTETLEMARKRP